jgi:phospholipase/carboxylesterase
MQRHHLALLKADQNDLAGLKPGALGFAGDEGVEAGTEQLKAEIRSRPPVFLAHGTMDQVIPVDALVSTVEALAENDIPRTWHVAHGMAHGIDRAGLSLGAQFLQKVLG